MDSLDYHTLLFFSILLGPVMALVLLTMQRTYPVILRGAGWWAQGALWTALCYLLLIDATNARAPLIFCIGYACSMIGLVQWVHGTEVFLGLRSTTRVLSGFAIASLAGVVWFGMFAAQFKAMFVIIGLTVGSIHIYHFRRLIGHSAKRFGSRFLAWSLLLLGVSWLLRMLGSANANFQGIPALNMDFQGFLHVLQVTMRMLTLLGFVLLAGERVREEFEFLATHDSLTGALMRRAWLGQGEAELARSQRHRRTLSLLAMDLDHFKNINDTLGHAAGDQALIRFVAGVNRLRRIQDSLGRLGGEEFVLLLPETDMAQAALVAERIRATTADAVGGGHCTVSIGVAEMRFGDDTLSSVLARADAAMYRAKSLGRNRVERDGAVQAVAL